MDFFRADTNTDCFSSALADDRCTNIDFFFEPILLFLPQFIITTSCHKNDTMMITNVTSHIWASAT